MRKTVEGSALAGAYRFAVVTARANEFISKRLLEDAVNTLERHGASAERITVVWVPGSLEIPVTAERLARSGGYDAVICLGVILRGDTVHFEHVADEVSRGMAAVALSTGVPVLHGVLAADSLEQAIQRAGLKGGNRGREAAVAAIAMADLMATLPPAARGASGGETSKPGRTAQRRATSPQAQPRRTTGPRTEVRPAAREQIDRRSSQPAQPARTESRPVDRQRQAGQQRRAVAETGGGRRTPGRGRQTTGSRRKEHGGNDASTNQGS